MDAFHEKYSTGPADVRVVRDEVLRSLVQVPEPEGGHDQGHEDVEDGEQLRVWSF